MRKRRVTIIFFCRLLIALFFILIKTDLAAQQIITQPKADDTTRIIQIIQGKSLREKTIDDSTTIQTIAGNVILKEAFTTFSCDSASINRRTNVLEAFGNIHINQSDSIHTYSQYLKYLGKERVAYLERNVKMTDKKSTLLTSGFEYNLATGIGQYTHGGKVINGKTVLTSEEGVYYSDTKDVYFRTNVHLTDPKYDIKNDSLLYNTQTQIATFISPTYIKSENGGDIYTTEGTYDLKSGKAFFGKRSIIKDSTRTYVADTQAFDEASGIAQLEGNAIIKDSVNGYTIIGNQIFLNLKTNSFLATRKPVLIFKGEGTDSTFIAADTLFSGIERRDSLQLADSLVLDTLKTTTTVNTSSDTAVRYFQAFHHVRIFNDSLQAVCDSLYYSSLDSTFRLFDKPVLFNSNSQISGDTIYLFTKNRKAERLYAFYNAMVINKANEQMYNQIGSRTLNGYFVNGSLDYIRAKGTPAESVFYPQDKDSAYIGMNRSKGDVIDIYFVDKEVNKVKFINDVDGTLYPLRQTPEDQKKLKGFDWQDKRRPKSRFELFE
ncbi:OstA-like protein [Ferruginibacter sp. SUN002]|uniref:OstA-like protein n=1 Tax=Ferruginibacter sp. SUN002 TaxID=2937789 RepID=UPI003D36B43D